MERVYAENSRSREPSVKRMLDTKRRTEEYLLTAGPLDDILDLKSPHVVKVIKKQINHKSNTLTLELQDCQPLKEYLDSHKKLDVSIACQLINDMIQGLLYLANKEVFFELSVEQFGVADDRLLVNPSNSLFLVTKSPGYLKQPNGLCPACFELKEMAKVVDCILEKTDKSQLSYESIQLIKRLKTSTWNTDFLSKISIKPSSKYIPQSTGDSEIIKVKVDARSISRNPKDISPKDTNECIAFKPNPLEDDNNLKRPRVPNRNTSGLGGCCDVPLKKENKSAIFSIPTPRTAHRIQEIVVSKSPLQRRGKNASYSQYKHYSLVYTYGLNVIDNLKSLIDRTCKENKTKRQQISHMQLTHANCLIVIYHNLKNLHYYLIKQTNFIIRDDWDAFINDPEKVDKSTKEFDKLLERIKKGAEKISFESDMHEMGDQETNMKHILYCIDLIKKSRQIISDQIEVVNEQIEKLFKLFENQQDNDSLSIITKSLRLVLNSNKYIPMERPVQFMTHRLIGFTEDGIFDWVAFKQNMNDIKWISVLIQQATKNPPYNK